MKSPIFILMLSSSLIACGGNVKNVQCSGMDWNEHGYKAAQSGKSPRDFNRYRDGCGDKLETGAVDAYLDGYTRGIVEFCTYENGYARGLSNKKMDNTCPVEMRSKYEQGYKLGLFELNEKIKLLKMRDDDTDMRDAADRGDSGMTPQ